MASFDFNFPTPESISKLIEQYSFTREGLVSSRWMPIDTTTYLQSPTVLQHDVLEPTVGMTCVSALDATPVLINKRVLRTEMDTPLYFKEEIRFGESDLINTRMPGKLGETAGGAYLTALGTKQLKTRVDTLIEVTNFMALNGHLEVTAPDGSIYIKDYGFETAQKPNVSTTSGYGGYYWSDHTNSTPLEDLRKAVQFMRYKEGYQKVTMVCTESVILHLSANSAITDLLKQSTLVVNIGSETLAQMLPSLIGAGIDEIVVCKQGYATADGNVPFMPENKVLLIGNPVEGTIGCWASVPNVESSISNSKAGMFIRVIDKTSEPTPYVSIVGGIYGLPILYRPDCIVSMQVLA